MAMCYRVCACDKVHLCLHLHVNDYSIWFKGNTVCVQL